MVTAGDGQVAGDPPFGPEFLEPNNDDNVYGDNMSPASSTTFRHYHININGISKQNDFVDAQNLANALQHTVPLNIPCPAFSYCLEKIIKTIHVLILKRVFGN